jgi:hypothetical protein
MIRTWKRLDFFIQALLILAGIAIVILGFDNDAFIYPYIIVGAWQMLSCLVNAVWTKGQWKVSDRKAYLITVLIVVLTGVIIYMMADLIGELIITYLLGLLILTPLMALWYLSICYREWQLIRTKDLMHLK